MKEESENIKLKVDGKEVWLSKKAWDAEKEFMDRLNENQGFVDFITNPEAVRKAQEQFKEMTKDYTVHERRK